MNSFPSHEIATKGGGLNTLSRPVLRYHGGKWKLAPWIISHFPEHRIYVEPFGGAASVLLRKPRCYAEIYNDLDGEIVNLFTIVRERGAELKERLRLTPFARGEYQLSFCVSGDLMEQARRTVARSFMGFGSNSLNRVVKSGFRQCSHRSGTTPAKDWKNFPDALDALIERLRGVTLENRPAIDILPPHDSTETLFYCDPPYPHSTRTYLAGRGSRAGYAHEMIDYDHQLLAGCLRNLKGKVIIGGYPCELYDRHLYPEWRRVERIALADGARKRTEVLWMNF